MEKQEILDEELEEISGGGMSLVITPTQVKALKEAGLIVDNKIDPDNIDEVKEFLRKNFGSDSIHIKVY